VKFYQILTRKIKPSASEVAAEIIEVEKSIVQHKDDISQAEIEDKKLRQAKLGGGQVANAEIQAAVKKLEDLRANLDALESAREDLCLRLSEIINEESATELEQINETMAKLREEKADLRKQLIKKTAELHVLRIAFDGAAGQGPSFCENREEREIFDLAVQKLVSDQKNPVFSVRQREAQNRLRLLNNQKIELVAAELLEKARAEAAKN